MADFKKYLEGFEAAPAQVEFVLKVEAFKAKHATVDSADSKSLLVMEAVKLYEEFFLGSYYSLSRTFLTLLRAKDPAYGEVYHPNRAPDSPTTALGSSK